MTPYFLGSIVGFCLGKIISDYWWRHAQWKHDRAIVDAVLLRVWMKYWIDRKL